MLTLTNLDHSRTAAFSECDTYRYWLLVRWNDSLPRMTSCGLNPSVASHLISDPTITRECERAAQMGFGSLFKVNLFAIRSTDPRGMLKAEDPYGEWRNPGDLVESILEHSAQQLICATWGNHGTHRGRSQEFCDAVKAAGLDLWAYEVNGTGQPKHPLYTGYAVHPKPFCPETMRCMKEDVYQ